MEWQLMPRVNSGWQLHWAEPFCKSTQRHRPSYFEFSYQSLALPAWCLEVTRSASWFPSLSMILWGILGRNKKLFIFGPSTTWTLSACICCSTSDGLIMIVLGKVCALGMLSVYIYICLLLFMTSVYEYAGKDLSELYVTSGTIRTILIPYTLWSTFSLVLFLSNTPPHQSYPVVMSRWKCRKEYPDLWLLGASWSSAITSKSTLWSFV